MSSGSILDTAKITTDVPPEMRHVASVHNCAVDLVAGLLRNPTDEQVESLADAVREVVYHDGDYFPDLIVRAVLTALAGGSDV